MVDDDSSTEIPEATTANTRWRLILTAIGLIVFVVLMLVAGTIMVNVEWPSTLGEWLKALLGGLLVLTSTIGGTYVIPAVRAVIRDKGGTSSDHRDKYLGIERLSEITRPRVLLSVGIAGGLIAGALSVPRISLPQQPPLEPGHIRLLSAIDESNNDARFTLIQQWNAAHPDNRVEITPAPGETDAQHERFVNDAMSAEPADVYLLDVVWMPEFIERDYIRPIDESQLDTYEGDPFLANVWETCRDVVGKRPGRWALPFNTDAGLMYYRKDSVAAPETWQEYLGEPAKNALDAAMRAAPGSAFEGASAAQLASEEVLTIYALEAIWAADGGVVDPAGAPILSSDGNEVEFDQNALTGLERLAAATRDPGVLVPGSDDADESASRNMFAGGKALFTRDWPVAYDNLEREMAARDFSFDVAPLRYRSVLGGQNLAISSKTEKPVAAQELIEFLTSPSSQLTLFEIGGFAPTRLSAYKDSKRPYAGTVRSAVEQARPRPFLVHYTEFSAAFRTGIRRALNNDGKLEPGFATTLADIVKKG